MIREFSQRLFYGVTRGLMLAAGFAPLAIVIFIIGFFIPVSPGVSFSVGLLPLVMIAALIAALVGLWRGARDASHEDIGFSEQFKFLLVSAAIWLSGAGLWQFIADYGGIAVALSAAVLLAGLFRQDVKRQMFYVFLWASGMAAVAVFHIILSLPTC